MESEKELALKKIIENQLLLVNELDRVERGVLEIRRNQDLSNLEDLNNINTKLELITNQYKGFLK
ncbi:MAG: hypothetical protein Q8R82_14285 [Hyphomonadaceae bacterium]|nr:hypothetical protein [Hyphomonadaceae bacterium]